MRTDGEVGIGDVELVPHTFLSSAETYTPFAMAGFGIFMELLFFAVLGLLGATVLSFALVHWAKGAIPVASPQRTSFVSRCRVQPFLGLVWVLFSFIVYSYCIGTFFHRDFGGHSLMEAYVQYRPIWFDWFFPAFSVMGLTWMFGSLVLQGWRQKRKSAEAPAST